MIVIGVPVDKDFNIDVRTAAFAYMIQMGKELKVAIKEA